jgi:phospholipid N-methyltransferase
MTENRRGQGNGKAAVSRRRQILRFGRAFFQEPAMLGSVIPSSRFLVNRTLKPIDWTQARVIVEYGPGLGTCTGEILRRMRDDARLLVFETHPDFVRHLRETYDDSRLEVIHDSAETVDGVLRDRGHDGADYVLSGIPFSLMPDETRDRILERTRDVLEPEGSMLVYQFSPTIGTHLKRVFDEVEWEFEPLNILPAVVFHCQARERGPHPDTNRG